MIVTRRVAWFVLLVAILTAGILRQFHARIPTSPFLPAPVGSLLFFLIVILGLLFARSWGQRQEVPYAGSDLRSVNFLALVPLLIALMLEKWVSVTMYGPVFTWFNAERFRGQTLNAVYVLESAVGLLLVCLFLLPMFRRLFPLLLRYVAPRRIPYAVLGLGFSLLCLYGGLALMFFLAGGEGAQLRWGGFGRATALVLGGQVLIAFAEEIYYRGLLQSEVAFLMPALGVSRERARLALSVVLISTVFAIEHFVPSGHIANDGRVVLFAFASSLLIGALLFLTENLWYCAGCHLALNLLTLGGGPATRGLQFVDGAGKPLLATQVYVFGFFIATFLFVYLYEAVGRRAKGLLPSSGLPTTSSR